MGFTSPPMTAASLLAGTPEAFGRANADDLARARAAVERVKSGPASLQTLRDWDAATAAISDASARASLLRSVHPQAEMRDLGERCEQEAEALSTAFALDPEIYDPLSKVDASAEDEGTRWYLFRLLRDFRRAGVDRDSATRARVRALNEELVRIGQEFQRNIRDDVRKIEVTRAELEGLPDDYVAAHAGGVITTDYPDYIPFMTYARSSAARERLWKVYRQRAHPKNLEVLDRMLARRFELGRVQQGIFDTSSRMFGVEYRRCEAPVWHAEVTAWELIENGRVIGRFFLDLHPREGKYKHAAQFTLTSGQQDGLLPEAALVCNFPSQAPALLEHSEVVTFFHEFGHLLHHL